MPLAFKLGLVITVILIVWRLVRSRFDFRIVIKNSKISYEGEISLAQQREFSQVLKELTLGDGVVEIIGMRDGNGRMRLNFRGPIHPSEQQCVCNLFYTSW